jgi:hypothetical protein
MNVNDPSAQEAHNLVYRIIRCTNVYIKLKSGYMTQKKKTLTRGK